MKDSLTTWYDMDEDSSSDDDASLNKDASADRAAFFNRRMATSRAELPPASGGGRRKFSTGAFRKASDTCPIDAAREAHAS